MAKDTEFGSSASKVWLEYKKNCALDKILKYIIKSL